MIAIIATGLLLLVLLSRKRRATAGVETAGHNPYALPVSAEMLQAEQEDNDEVVRLLEVAISQSGFFRPEKIPELMSKLRRGVTPFARVNTQIAFDGDFVLSVEEKRALGLNTRMKYSKSFIEYLQPQCLRVIEPKSTLENMHLTAFHRVARKRELRNFRVLGLVKKVEISPVGDERDCDAIKQLKKIHNLNEIPELPLPDCTAPYCRCMYLPVISRSQ